MPRENKVNFLCPASRSDCRCYANKAWAWPWAEGVLLWPGTRPVCEISACHRPSEKKLDYNLFYSMSSRVTDILIINESELVAFTYLTIILIHDIFADQTLYQKQKN